MVLGQKLMAAASAAFLSVASAAYADVNLTFHTEFGEAGLNEGARVWMDMVEERTEGRVTFNRLFGGPLGKFTGQPTGIKARSFDVGDTSSVYNPGLYPRSTVAILPFISDNMDAHAKAMHTLQNSDDFKAEFDALNQKFLFNSSWIWIQTMSHVPLKTMDDLADKKIRAHGGSAEALTAAGITSYAIPFGELPAAAEKKVVDVVTMGGPSGMVDFGFGDIFSHWNDNIIWNWFPMTMVMNQDSWDSIPAEDQAIIEEINAEMVDVVLELVWAQENAAKKALMETYGTTVVQFEETDKLVEFGEASWGAWIEDMKGKGIDGQALIDTYKDLYAKNLASN